MSLDHLVRRVDVSNVDHLSALCSDLDISREAIVNLTVALGPLAGDVRFYAMS